MSGTDQYYDQADQLLQCCGKKCGFDRRAVAAALRETYKKGYEDGRKRNSVDD